MSAALVAYWVLTLAAGGAVVSLVRVPLHLEERVALSVVTGIAGGTLFAFLAALTAGIRTAAVLAGPAALLAGAVLVVTRLPDPWRGWRVAVRDARRRWRDRSLWPMAALVAVAAGGAAVLFAHTLYADAGGIEAGFPTVWADWSLHATTASSFAVGHNLPPSDPIFSGSALRYPFLPDYQSGMLLTAGSGIAAALAVPDAVLLVAVTVIVVSLSQRLVGSFAAGVIAMSVVLLGGGLGFAGLWWDACAHHGLDAAACAPQRFLHAPAGALSDWLATLRDIPAAVAAQPRAYDGLLTAPSQQPVGNLQWYTPLLAWWLPQRSFVYGFAMTTGALLLLVTGIRRRRRAWSPFAVAGALAGLLPLYHPHSLLALVLALPLVALLHRRREWLLMAAVTAVLALPRLVQLAAAPHGAPSTPYGPNAFPWFEPGWKWNADGAVRFGVSAHGAVEAAVTALRVAVTPSFWGFWLVNGGVLVPVAAVLLAGTVLRRTWSPQLRAAGTRIGALVPPRALAFCLPFLLIFAAANVVVFQSWDWDNTKVLVYWQLALAILVGAWAVRWLRAGGLRSVSAAGAVAVTLLSGALVMLRLLPWTPASMSVGGPYSWATTDERALAAAVDSGLPSGAVVLTGGRPNDPVLTLAGRSAVMGYAGWLWSYGTVFGRRPTDVVAMYRGCADIGSGDCQAARLLRRYGVSAVEIGPWERNPVNLIDANDAWYGARFPVLARRGDIVVYDVRRA